MLNPDECASCPSDSILFVQARDGVQRLAADAQQTPAAAYGVCFQWPSHLRSRSQVEEPPLNGAERDAAAAALSTAEPLPAPAMQKSAADVSAAVEHATAEDIVDRRHQEPPVSNDKLVRDHSDSHVGASSVLLQAGAATVSVIKEDALGTELTATTAAMEDAAAADEGAGHVDADDTALAMVPAVADPESLVDFPFNSRRGEARAAPCSAGVCCTQMFGSDGAT